MATIPISKGPWLTLKRECQSQLALTLGYLASSGEITTLCAAYGLHALEVGEYVHTVIDLKPLSRDATAELILYGVVSHVLMAFPCIFMHF